MRVSKRFVAATAVALVVGLTGGMALAGQATWMRPGDDVSTLEDADRALSWWRGAPHDSATYEPTSLREANDRLWLTMGQVVDDLMGLDIRSRSFYMRSERGVMTDGLLVLGLRIFCDEGDYAVSGGWAVDTPPEAGTVAEVTASIPALVAAGPSHAWQVSFRRVGPGKVTVHGYAVCAEYGA